MTLQLAANLSLLFNTHVPWPQRCARAATAGFRQVEILFPYDQPVARYRQWLDAAGLQTVLINTPVANHMGLAAVDGAQARFQRDLNQATTYAHALGATYIHVIAGRAQGQATTSLSTLLRNLEYALRRVEGSGLILTLEALNRYDVPGYFYHHPEQVLAVLKALPSPQLRQQFDFYHTQREALDLVTVLQRCRPGIAHVQIARAPARNEPVITHAVRAALHVLVASGYKGVLGCEYKPARTFESGLGWLRALQCLPGIHVPNPHAPTHTGHHPHCSATP